jgi:DNA-binding transcriptional MocR family regulator
LTQTNSQAIFLPRYIDHKEEWMLLKIDRKLSDPIYKQIINEIKALIDQGWLGSGQRLPSSRDLAEQLGVTRSTVCQAYAELQALGYLQSRPGSYNTVQQRRKEVVYNPEYHSLVDWKKSASAEAGKLYEIFLGYTPERSQDSKENDIPFDLTSITLDPRLYPLADFRRCIHHVLLDSGAESLQYGSYKGFHPLCEFISKRLRLHGISVSEDEILITSGRGRPSSLSLRLIPALFLFSGSMG